MIDGQSRLLDYASAARGMDAYYEKALTMLHSDKLRSAFDLSKEPRNCATATGARPMAGAGAGAAPSRRG
jgi:hypothetical protein